MLYAPARFLRSGCHARSRALPAGITNRVGRPYPAQVPVALDLAPETNTITRERRTPSLVIAGLLVGRSPRRPRLWWSRPMPADVCSMFARMPGTRRQHPVSAASHGFRRPDKMAAPGTFRHRPAPGQRGILEQSSGLLIRGPGFKSLTAPGLTWGFTTSGHFCVRFVPVVAPWLLADTDPAIRVLSKTAHPAPDPGAGTPGPGLAHCLRPTPPRLGNRGPVPLPRCCREARVRGLCNDARRSCWPRVRCADFLKAPEHVMDSGPSPRRRRRAMFPERRAAGGP